MPIAVAVKFGFPGLWVGSADVPKDRRGDLLRPSLVQLLAQL
jgi:hypothetical protein